MRASTSSQDWVPGSAGEHLRPDLARRLSESEMNHRRHNAQWVTPPPPECDIDAMIHQNNELYEHCYIWSNHHRSATLPKLNCRLG